MEDRQFYILMGVLIIYILASCWVVYFNIKYKKEAKESEREQKEIFNKCIDLIIEGKDEEAKELYNECLFHRNDRRPFLNGLFIGLDLKKNEERLLEHKYDLSNQHKNR